MDHGHAYAALHAHHHPAGAGPVYQGRFKSVPVQTAEHFLTVARAVERREAAIGDRQGAGRCRVALWRDTGEGLGWKVFCRSPAGHGLGGLYPSHTLDFTACTIGGINLPGGR